MTEESYKDRYRDYRFIQDEQKRIIASVQLNDNAVLSISDGIDRVSFMLNRKGLENLKAQCERLLERKAIQ